jgi:hypothetical protein
MFREVVVVLTKVENDGKHDGEVRVVLNLAKERMSSFKNSTRNLNQVRRKTWLGREIVHGSCVDVNGSR